MSSGGNEEHGNGRGWIGASILSIAYTSTAALPLYLVGASAAAFQARIGIGTAEFGYAIACYFAGGALVAIRVGSVVDRIGPAQALRLGMVATAGASSILGWVSNTWLVLALGLAVCGVGHVFCQLGTNRLLAGQSVRRRALGFGLKQAGIPAASLLAGFATAALTPPTSPTSLFAVSAALAVAGGGIAPRLAALDAPSEEGPRREARGRSLLRLTLAAGLAAGAGNTLSVLVVDSFNAQGFAEHIGPTALGLGGAAALLSRTAIGWAVDRRHSDGRTELRIMLTAGAVSFALLAVSSGSAVASSIAAVFALGTGWGWHGVAFFVASTQPTIPPATGSGWVLAGTMGGSIVGPLAIATLAEAFGYGLGWTLASALLALAAVLTEPGRKATAR